MAEHPYSTLTARILTVSALLAAVLFAVPPGAGAQDKIAANAKAFQTEIEAMKGRPVADVLNKFEGWKFEPLAAWITKDPASKDFKRYNTGKTKFSKKEIEAVFQKPGEYKIAVYGLLVGTESATTGSIDEFGRGVDKDAAYLLQIYTAVRVVFLDGSLVDVRTWPKVESSEVSGGKWRIR